MSISRSFNKEPLNGHRDLEVDSVCLAVTTARLVEKINKHNFRFTVGEPMMKAVMGAGVHIRKACAKYTSVGKRAAELKEAQEFLESLAFAVEVALCSSLITAEEKATFDIVFKKVSGQLEVFLSSLISKLKHNDIARQSLGGNASGEFSE